MKHMAKADEPHDEPLPNTVRFVYLLGGFILVGWVLMAIFVWRSW
jgi:hypothetical protein